MEIDYVFRVIEIVIQLAVLVVALFALSTWKREIRGRDRFHTAKSLLEYIKNLRFLIYTKSGSMHQIYLNDILNDRNAFYEDQLFSIKNEKILFDENVWNLLSHLNVRSDFFFNKDVRDILMDIYPTSGKILTEDKSNVTYVQVDSFASKLEKDFGSRLANLQ